jgi:hypothetical protein
MVITRQIPEYLYSQVGSKLWEGIKKYKLIFQIIPETFYLKMYY